MDEESEFLFDKDIIMYIGQLKEKYKLEGEIDPHDFLHKIQLELNLGTQNSKQKSALEEIKRSLQEEIYSHPIELENDDIDSLDESNDLNDLTPEEQQYLLMHELQDSDDMMNIDYKNNLRLALLQNLAQNQVEDYEDEVGDNEDTKPDFNQQHKFQFNKPMPNIHPSNLNIVKIHDKIDKRMFTLAESENDSKESTSKTPCFIGTPTSNSQLGSLNGTGAVRAEDLIHAMQNSSGENNVRRYIQFSSSNNSSTEKLQRPITGIHATVPIMSFGGDSTSDYINEQVNEHEV